MKGGKNKNKISNNPLTCIRNRHIIKNRTIVLKYTEMRLYMGAKDAKAREFLSNNERFADLFNFYLFKGKQVIKPSDLQEKDTATVLSLYGIDKKEVQKQRWRDLLKSAIVKET